MRAPPDRKYAPRRVRGAGQTCLPRSEIENKGNAAGVQLWKPCTPAVPSPLSSHVIRPPPAHTWAAWVVRASLFHSLRPTASCSTRC
ncbi:hypothetical protein EON67_06575 [archaeon]|nr:MAG: hypothetical protein EON67_06575 [archaeon]